MGILHYTIDINAPKQIVWKTMLDEATYRQWTTVFGEGSYYEGSWDEGSDIRFLAPEEDGSLSGIASKVIKNTPYEYISLEHAGEIVKGQVDTTSEGAKQWIGGHENYQFSEQNGVTTVAVELDGVGINEELRAMFEGMWPAALEKLKELAEAAATTTIITEPR